MFVLRFFAGPIVEHINPLGLLFVSAVLGCIGLVHDGKHAGAATPAGGILVAATIYGVGKTFFWPTMLGVVGERFPKGGALAMGAMGGIGMVSAGMLGGPGIGYTQDVNIVDQAASSSIPRFTSKWHRTKKTASCSSRRSRASTEPRLSALADRQSRSTRSCKQATTYGRQQALKITAGIPATMAVGYLMLLIYFRAIGGYKLVEIGPGGVEHEVSETPTAKEAIYDDSRPTRPERRCLRDGEAPAEPRHCVGLRLRSNFSQLAADRIPAPATHPVSRP